MIHDKYLTSSTIIVIFILIGMVILSLEEKPDMEKIELLNNIHDGYLGDKKSYPSVVALMNKEKKIKQELGTLNKLSLDVVNKLEANHDNDLSIQLRKYSRCKEVSGKTRMGSPLSLKNIKYGAPATKDECFQACNDDIKCQQAVYRMQKKSSSCFPMSNISSGSLLSTPNEENKLDFVTLQCGMKDTTESTLLTQNFSKILGDYEKERIKYQDKIGGHFREMNSIVNENVLGSGMVPRANEFLKESQKELVKMHNLSDKLDASVSKRNQELDLQNEYEAKLVESQFTLNSNLSHLYLWILISILGVGGLILVSMRKFK